MLAALMTSLMITGTQKELDVAGSHWSDCKTRCACFGNITTCAMQVLHMLGCVCGVPRSFWTRGLLKCHMAATALMRAQAHLRAYVAVMHVELRKN